MDITGELVHVGEVQVISDKFRKREFVIEDSKNPQYPEFIKFELHQDRTDLIDSYAVGQPITVHFDLRGRKWEAPDGVVKYFNTVVAWRLQAAGGPPTEPPKNEPPQPRPDEYADEVPF